MRYPHIHPEDLTKFTSQAPEESSNIVHVAPPPSPLISLTHTTATISDNDIEHTEEIVKLKEISESENKKSKVDYTSVNSVTPHSVFSSFSPIIDNLVSWPNPGDYPIISLIDKPPGNYHQQVYPTDRYCQTQPKPASQSSAKLGWDILNFTTELNHHLPANISQKFSE